MPEGMMNPARPHYEARDHVHPEDRILGNPNAAPFGVEHDRGGLSEDLERNAKSIAVLQEVLQDLYDRLTPILGQERPTDDQDSAKAMVADFSPMREVVRRQGRLIDNLTSDIHELMTRIEL